MAHVWPTKVRLLAGELVRAASIGDPRAYDLSFELAEAVGETLEPMNILVAAIAAGGPFTVRRGLELVAAMPRNAPELPVAPTSEHTPNGAGER